MEPGRIEVGRALAHEIVMPSQLLPAATGPYGEAF